MKKSSLKDHPLSGQKMGEKVVKAYGGRGSNQRNGRKNNSKNLRQCQKSGHVKKVVQKWSIK